MTDKKDDKSDQFEGDLSEILSPGIQKQKMAPLREPRAFIPPPGIQKEKVSFGLRLLEVLVKVAVFIGILLLFAWYFFYGFRSVH